MKRFTPLILTIILFALVSLGLTMRPAHAVVTVYNYKNMPGIACKITQCQPHPTTVTNLDQLVNNSLPGPQLSIPDIVSDDPVQGACTLSCPIVHDNVTDVVGTRFAWIDIGMVRLTVSGTRQVSCALYTSTGKYTVGTQTFIDTQPGTTQIMSNPPAGTPITVARLNFASPWPTVPSGAAAHGASYADGYASINCQVPSQTAIYGYGWQEIGGNSNDF